MNYFILSQKQTIKLDAEKSPWLYIVKSGKVKVIKRVKALTNNEIRLTSPLKSLIIFKNLLR